MLSTMLTLLQTAGVPLDSAAIKVAKDAAMHVSVPVLEMMGNGGFVMYLLAGCLLLSIYFIVERFIYIRNRAKMDPNLLAVVKDNLKENREEAALAYCQRIPTAQAQVMATGLNFLGSNMREIESAMETRANVELSAMEGNLGYLSLVARIAPMLGFVGTIWGVINIFYTISQTNGLEIGGIAEGLYIKMVTSFAGLLVGIISFIGYQLFVRKVDRFAERLQEQSLSLLEVLNKANH
ncbi:MAG: biopolymer transporter ExbB [Flavobacteriales bacterium]|nr:MotA/TolQ/ExbB proton channel family protein [Flavobacteriaceae bacterium]PHX92633.1 MAG: biopolymer transporter ExbB [Flavobacteriales bacterium]